ncbi:acyl-CoA thioester hydrolase [Blastomyces silverae]|uniref:Acyl-CoA thioester hydrolase n=1 Tax=Blastomyces silverae TaxID=2060906 RepID=A0A0H1BWF3_9EURO|nr:acyl-CoA thioester hydrolase [Blastomyces silverae]
MAPTELELKKRRTRNHYLFHLEYRTRWSDNDMYAHLNNSIYAFLIDSIVNTYLINHCGLDPFSARSSAPPPSPSSSTSSSTPPTRPSQIGLVVSSYCDYFASVSFPDVLDLGLRVVKLGSSSVMYEVGIFRRGEETVKAVGGFTHVFVEKEPEVKSGGGGGGRAARKGMDGRIRSGLERLMIHDVAGSSKL